MRIAILAPGYPSEERPYNYAFVHARARLYAARDEEVAAFAPGPAARWTLDGIPALTGGADALVREIQAFGPDVLAIHAPNFHTIPVARRIDRPQVSWVHGHEAIFTLRGVQFARTARERAKKWAKVIPRNVYQLLTIRGFLPDQKAVVFVSRWMQRTAEAQTRRRYPNAVIVPNPVDTRLFGYALDPARIREGISTRSLNNTKYGLDVAVRAFARETGAHLTIVGEGSLEGSLRRLIARTGSATTLEARSVAHRDMKALFARHGFFVAPSRVEAQGVAMCEAMASGLPVVATSVGGIPEFVTDGEEGYLVPPEDPTALAAAVRRLVSDPDRHLAFSRAARRRAEAQFSADVITERELALLREG